VRSGKNAIIKAGIDKRHDIGKLTSAEIIPCSLYCGKVLGCNNGIGGFHKNIVTFRGPKLPDCSLAQKMYLKKCSSLVQ